MGIRLHPTPEYPFTLDVRIDYRLGAHGLEVTTTATNAGDRPCPYGCGQHPYLSPGAGLVDECTLQLDAAARITTDRRRRRGLGCEPMTCPPNAFVTGTDVLHLRPGESISTQWGAVLL